MNTNFLLEFRVVTISCLVSSSFQISLGVENVEDFFFANTESSVSSGFTFNKNAVPFVHDRFTLLVEANIRCADGN